MTDEERQRTMEFILEHQAQLTVSQQKTEEILAALAARQDRAEARLAETGERLASVEERVSRLETAMRELAVAQAEMSRTQAEMSRTQEQMVRAQTHMNEVVAVMADAQTRTDERLNALIGVVERHISHGHNGN